MNIIAILRIIHSIFVVSATFVHVFDTSIIQQPVGTQLGNVGTFPKWSRVEVIITGPESEGMNHAANPFKLTVDVTFTGPDGQTFVVPAFYDGDGMGGLDGNVWKVRFSPNAVGAWSFRSDSDHPLLTGYIGSFTVVEPTGCTTGTPAALPNFACVGRLEYVGRHYLKFANGAYWLKGGADEPEDFLAPNETAGFTTKEEAIDYLANKGVNSIYLLLHNVDGDGENVWPWMGDTQAQAKVQDEHFDLAKLARWEELFTYIQARGLVLHLVFEDDSAWTGFNRAMFYREMVARFGHHNGLYWNIVEEFNENYSASQVKDFAQLIRDLDPYDHPITVHHKDSLDSWNPFVGDPRFDLTSFQTKAVSQNVNASDWVGRVAAAGRPIPISFDETGKLKAHERGLARHIVWSVYLGGGNYELFTKLNSGGYYDFAKHFEDMTRARQLLEQYPFWEMQSANALLVRGQGYVFAQPDEVSIVYLPSGGSIDLDLSTTTHRFTAHWFDPRDGSSQEIGGVEGGAVRSFIAPNTNDWVLVVEQALHAATPTMTQTPMVDQATATATSTPTAIGTPVPMDTVLLRDEFDRPDNAVVGNGWVEVETSDAAVALVANQLCFVDSSDVRHRPTVQHRFPQVTAGEVRWRFTFDWQRTGAEGTYRLFLQLGEGAQLQADNSQAGVGVNLVWTAINGRHERLGARQGTTTTPLQVVRGPTTIEVVADVSTHTYTVAIDGQVVQTGLPFDNAVGLDTVRLMTDALNEQHFTGRCFDAIDITRP